MHMSIYSHTPTHTTYTHVYAYTYTHIYVHEHIHKHAYTYTLSAGPNRATRLRSSLFNAYRFVGLVAFVGL